MGAERLTVTPGGNVGIGTGAPNDRLTVEGTLFMRPFAQLSSFRNANNNYINLFLVGTIRYENASGNYRVVGEGGSNYFGAIRMDATGGSVGAINFHTGVTIGGSDYISVAMI
ncbi:hypothetical protein KHS38_01400 [Mucilaginibacter sp. Bleaf8]|uniref:hypothetical protein n=1 Tax=Mucilaginibacter sp. Bleaf8 TaxID=2834430 RepID=UPI001BCF715C|nr:hypothetical protein [Mucilaginibacter sp. Bleaf8]MBS7563046.1 hypothetical protein [Mucilaginibacter sp. Bleaf8]